MAYRRWRTGWTWISEERTSDVTELPAVGEERGAHIRTKRVLHGTPNTIILEDVTAIPVGTDNQPTRERRVARVADATAGRWADALRRKRRRVVWAQIPEPALIPQVGERPLLRWRQIIANRDADRRTARIRGTRNELMYNYSWGETGDFLSSLLEEIQRHMLEPVGDGGRTWFDPFWTRDEVLDWLEARVNKFILQTGAYRAQETVTAAEWVALPDQMNELRRAVYFSGDGTSNPLEIGDLHARDMSYPGWESLTAGVPDYLITWGQGLKGRLSPPPNGGTVLFDYVPKWSIRGAAYERGSFWTAQRLAEAWPGDLKRLPIPNIFYPHIKYGVMADMLSKEGEAHDPKRAEYCESRFSEGVELAKMMLGRK